MYDQDFIDWLLESEIPSIRYQTLRRIVCLPAADPQVQTAWDQMKRSGPIPAILKGQTGNGSWVGESSFYTPKYVSTHWSMMLLAELAADPLDPGLDRGAEYMLVDTQQKAQRLTDSGGHGLECFWGNLLRYTLHSGRGDDERLANVIERLAVNAPASGWRCKHNDERPCAWGAARALWGLAALPARLRTGEVDTAINEALRFLLVENNLVKADFPTPYDGKVHSFWSRINFPLFYQADILFILRVLADLGALEHPNARPALDWLAARRGKNGRWRGASPFRSRTWKEIGNPEETSRWVSLQAAQILSLS